MSYLLRCNLFSVSSNHQEIHSRCNAGFNFPHSLCNRLVNFVVFMSMTAFFFSLISSNPVAATAIPYLYRFATPQEKKAICHIFQCRFHVVYPTQNSPKSFGRINSVTSLFSFFTSSFPI